MSSIKERVTKKCHSDPRVTIDTLHKAIVDDLDEGGISSYYLDNGLLLDSYYIFLALESCWCNLIAFLPYEIAINKATIDKIVPSPKKRK